MKREFDPDKPELMDRDQAVTPELEADLENLRRLNQFFGSHHLIRRFLRRWMQPGGTYRVLDLATGPGDIPREMVRWGRKRNISLVIDAVDRHPSTLEVARNLSNDFPEIFYHHANALEYSNLRNYDLVCCSLALHHFSDDDAVRLLRRCRELSQGAVLVADLERTRSAALGVFLPTTLIFREPMTRYDARLSVRRSFSFEEMTRMAEAAGWHYFRHARFPFCRQAIWIDPPEVARSPAEIPLSAELPRPCADS